MLVLSYHNFCHFKSASHMNTIFLLSVVLTVFVSHNVCLFLFHVFSPFQVLPAMNFTAVLKYPTESV